MCLAARDREGKETDWKTIQESKCVHIYSITTNMLTVRKNATPTTIVSRHVLRSSQVPQLPQDPLTNGHEKISLVRSPTRATHDPGGVSQDSELSSSNQREKSETLIMDSDFLQDAMPKPAKDSIALPVRHDSLTAVCIL